MHSRNLFRPCQGLLCLIPIESGSNQHRKMQLASPEVRQVKLAALRPLIGIDETSWYSSQVYPL
jgi:hypothetical protein